MKKTIVMLLFVFALVSLLLSCGDRRGETAVTEINEETARLFSHVTGGIISPDDPVKIRFTSPVAPASLVGKALKSDIILTNPRIKGRAIWEDRRTIRLIPEAELESAQTYILKLDLTELSKEIPALSDFASSSSDTGLDLRSSFTVAENRISLIESDFRLLDESDPRKVRFYAELKIDNKIEPESLSKACSLRLDRRPVDLEILPGSSPEEVKLLSAPIERNSERREFELGFSARKTGLKEDFLYKTTLEPITSFTLTSLHQENEGKEVSLKLEFSDELASAQVLTGLLRTEPYLPLETKVFGKNVNLYGDFEPGEQYTVLVSKGIESKWGTKIAQETANQVEVENIKPQMEFVRSGVFLSSAGDRRIHFKTVNLRRVHLEVKKVFDNNLGQFLQTEQLVSNADRNREFNTTYVNRVGVTVANEVLEIGEEKNRWLIHELDLRKLIDPSKKGLYLLNIYFERNDMIWDLEEDGDGYYYGDDYYNDPRSYGYLWSHGRIYKPLMVSDIGLIWKQAEGTHTIYATDIINTKPLSGVKVSLRTYQNQTAAESYTDREGKVRFSNIDENIFYMVGERGDMRSVIKANEMAWNVSSFDTGGSAPKEGGIQAFLYTERGVYRPGDSIHLSAIVRNRQKTFPDNHPVKLSLYNPRGQKYLEEINTEGKDGFYYFHIKTSDDDPTGSWRAEIEAGDAVFTKNIDVETIVPNRLKININTEKEELGPQDRFLNINFSSSYLFGAPAAGLKAEVNARLVQREKKVSSFPGFSFANQAMDYSPSEKNVFSGTLPADGKTEIEWELPSFKGAPSALKLLLDAAVSEKGGRATRGMTAIPVEPYAYYVGLQKPEMKYGYAQIGSRLNIPAVLVDSDGNPISGRQLEYRLYKNERYWWWEYESYENFRIRYKSDSNTELIDQGSLRSKSKPVSISVEPDSWGEYLIEVEDRDGHKAGFFFRASSWSNQAIGPDEGILSLSRDRDSYVPGDTARLTAVTPPEGRLLFTVEKGGEIIHSEWKQSSAGETHLTVPVTEDMVPTAYVSIALLQPHAQTANDRPIRMYGIIPLPVEDPGSREEIEIISPEEIKPQEDFEVTVQMKDRKRSQFTLAVVDEGLLDITAFSTPDPWNSFYSKQRLLMKSYDLFSQVIGAFSGDIFRVFSIGGGEAEMMRAYAPGEDEERRRRFEPVALFSPPQMTDYRGRATVRFSMPNYLGSVRIMAVSATGGSYGQADKTVPVRRELVVFPSLPRVLGPAENFSFPVSLFALKDIPGRVRIEVETEGPVNVIGSSMRNLSLSKNDEKDLEFKLKTIEALGQAKITVRAQSIFGEQEYPTNIEVRASSPVLNTSQTKAIEAGRSASFDIPTDGIEGSNRAVISITRRENLNIGNRLRWLMRYPYGCIEQTVSAAFPQLYLKDFIEGDERDEKKIDEAINATIDRLRSFQLPSGGFSYWPGNQDLSIWGTNYAGHFLLAAEDLGYHVPSPMKSQWLRFQSSRALSMRDNLTERIYRLYLLTLADSPAAGAMNLILENSLGELTNLEKWLLAASYHLSGMRSTANRIIAGAGTGVSDYEETGGTYGSTLRDQAMILDAATITGRESVADDLFSTVSSLISSDSWYSTQTTGYSLLAMGKYLESIEGPGDLLSGMIYLPSGKTIAFNTSDRVFKKDISEEVYDDGDLSATTKQLTVRIDPATSSKRVFANLEWEGQPLVSRQEGESKNLDLSISWYSENGKTIGVRRLEQGEEFWAHFSLEKDKSFESIGLEEVALNFILPAGWEVVNTRLSGEGYPWWMDRFNLRNEEYLDIRDDRVSWFFDMPAYRNGYDFAVKLQAVTKGEFNLPPVKAHTMYRDDFQALGPGMAVRVEED